MMHSRQDGADVGYSCSAAKSVRLDREPHRARSAAGPFAVDGRLRRISRQLVTPRSWLLAVAHGFVFAGVYWFAYLLRFDFSIPDDNVIMFSTTLAWVVGLKVVVFGLLAQYHGWWRYVTFADLVALVRATILSLCVLAAATFLVRLPIPRGVLVLDGVMTLFVLSAVRASWRISQEVVQPMFGDKNKNSRWALLVGTDLSNGILAHQIQSHFHMPYRVRGLLATGQAGNGARLGQIPILGSLDDVGEIAQAYRITDVLVVAGTLPGGRVARVDAGMRSAPSEPEDHSPVARSARGR